MLDVAINYNDELQKKFRETWYKEKYKFWHCACYYDDFEPQKGTWGSNRFVSLDSEGNLIGYIGYTIDRADEYVYALNIINFSDNKVVFGMDAGRVIEDIFEKFNFRKLCFEVVVGNPIEKTYDKWIEKYGGRIVGIHRNHVKLIDGKFYDLKMYEIQKTEYMEIAGRK